MIQIPNLKKNLHNITYNLDKRKSGNGGNKTFV